MVVSDTPRKRVAVVGATGVAGQQFLVSLQNHPWFELTTLAASHRSAGKTYRQAITTSGGQQQWGCEEPLPAEYAAAWQQAAPSSVVENLYGPTEATIAFTQYRWDDSRSPAESANGIVPLG